MKFCAKILIKTYDKGGRIQMPEGSGYSPYIEINHSFIAVRFHDVSPSALLDTETFVNIEILYPDSVNKEILKNATRFNIIEGAKDIGFGEILDSTLHPLRPS